MREDNTRRVYALGALDDYEVADHEPDVRGWTVYSADGLQLGAVDELIVDPQARKVRYLAVDVSRAADRSEEPRVMVPVGAARLRPDEDSVVLEGLSAVQLAALPRYPLEGFHGRQEDELRERLLADRLTADIRTSYYDHDLYDDSRFYASRRG